MIFRLPSWVAFSFNRSCNMNKLFILNPEFDLNLSNRPIADKIKKASKQMSPLLIPALKKYDKIISNYSVDQSFYDYLSKNGINGAAIFSEDSSDIIYRAECWGVDKYVLSTFNSIKNVVVEFPDCKIVKEINSREFAYETGVELNIGVNGSRLITRSEMIKKESSTYVIKPLFGNAGSGFIYSDKESLENIKDRVASLIESDGAVIVEPWLEKIDDIATLINISKDGKIAILGHHRNISNRAGVFYANYIYGNDPVTIPWKSDLDLMAVNIATAAYKKGYWGYIGIDSITFQDNNKLSIAMAIDINGRAPISVISYGIKENLGCRKPFLYRFISKRRVQLPDSYEELIIKLGKISYNTKTKRGVIMVTPIFQNVGRSIEKPPRTAWVIIGDDEKDTFDLDKQLREIVLKR